MVDYSQVRLGCPSVSFIFAHLCGLLESMVRKRPGVGLFVGRDCSYHPILLVLFPLLHHSIGIAQTLAMFGEEVRSSELKTFLSSSEGRGALEVSFLSTPYKAWSIHCALKEKDEGWIRNRFKLPPSIKVRIPDCDDRVCHSYADKVCHYKVDFANDLRFPLHPFIRELFYHLLLTLAQLVPNSWRIVICCMVVWMSANYGDIIRVDEFLHFYHLRRSKISRYWEFKPWDRSSRLFLDSPSSLQNWKMSFFFVSSEGWETVLGENPDDILRLLRCWGTPISGVSFYHICGHIFCVCIIF